MYYSCRAREKKIVFYFSKYSKHCNMCMWNLRDTVSGPICQCAQLSRAHLTVSVHINRFQWSDINVFDIQIHNIRQSGWKCETSQIRSVYDKWDQCINGHVRILSRNEYITCLYRKVIKMLRTKHYIKSKI
jgi:hypothetical protein